ncbi:hypothetical protein Tco_0212709 [Tanacetum coccineum]
MTYRSWDSKSVGTRWFMTSGDARSWCVKQRYVDGIGDQRTAPLGIWVKFWFCKFSSLILKVGATVPIESEELEASEPSGVRVISPHSLVSPDSTPPLSPDHSLSYTSPTRASYYHGTARMAVRTQPAMSLGFSARLIEVIAMSPSSFRKRYRPSYETLSSSSLSTFPSRNRYRGTSELVEDTKEEEEESSELEDEREDAEDEVLGARDEGTDVGVKGTSLGDEEAAPEGEQQVASVVDTVQGEPLGLGYGALRHRMLELRKGETPLSPEWSSGSLPVLLADSSVPTSVASLAISSPVASPATVKAESFLAELGAQVEFHGGLIHDHIVLLEELSPTLFERHERDFRELFTRSGAVDAHRADMWHTIYDTQRENQELRLEIAEGDEILKSNESILVDYQMDKYDWCLRAQISYAYARSVLSLIIEWISLSGTDNEEKDEKQNQDDKTGLGMEKTVKDKVKKSTEKSTGQSQSQPKSTPRPKDKEIQV